MGGGELAAGEPQEQMELFGEWQTYAYEPPRAIDGVVPRSARGHVEMWTEAHLPLGTVWLRHWPLQDILLVQVVRARTNCPFILPARLIAHTVAMLLHDYWAIHALPPRPPFCMLYTEQDWY